MLKVMWPDRELNSRPPRSIPGALTTELYDQGYMAYLGGFDPSTSSRTNEVRCKDYTTQQTMPFIWLSFKHLDSDGGRTIPVCIPHAHPCLEGLSLKGRYCHICDTQSPLVHSSPLCMHPQPLSDPLTCPWASYRQPWPLMVNPNLLWSTLSSSKLPWSVSPFPEMHRCQPDVHLWSLRTQVPDQANITFPDQWSVSWPLYNPCLLSPFSSPL